MTKVLAHQERQKWLSPREEEEIEVRPFVPLFEAWSGLTDPKPSLSTVIKAVKNGELPGEIAGESGIVMVPRDDFATDLALWVEVADWHPPGTRYHSKLPVGYVVIVDFVRRIVTRDRGVDAGLYSQEKSKFAQLSFRAHEELTAGVLPTAKRASRGEWAAPENDVRNWLLASFGIGQGA